MAIAEALGIGRIGLFQRVAERVAPKTPELELKPVTQFTRSQTLDLVRAYQNSLWHLRKPYSPAEEARLSGTLDVERMALQVMGQHHIVQMNEQTFRSAVPIKEDELTAEIRSFSENDVKRLQKIYRDSRSFTVLHKLEDKKWTQIKPDEMRIYARMTTSGQILEILGQRHLAISVNDSFTSESQGPIDLGEGNEHNNFAI